MLIELNIEKKNGNKSFVYRSKYIWNEHDNPSNCFILVYLKKKGTQSRAF